MSDTLPPSVPLAASPEGQLEDEGDRPSLDSLPPAVPPGAGRGPRVFVVSGGKGGLGKTVLAANLGVYLASVGRRALLVDADTQGANAHTLVGVPGPLARRSHDPI